MDFFDNFSVNNLHHAYLLVGDISFIRPKIFDMLSDQGVIISGNPDFLHLSYDTLTIDLARELSLAVEKKDFGGKKKIFVLEINIITEEAQNALLKVLEEPTVGTHFFILMPQDILLPTLRSRMLIIKSENLEIPKLGNVSEKSIAERIQLVKEITEGISDEEKTKQDAVKFLNRIESELYFRGIKENSRSLSLCQKTREALYDRGAPIKMILEQLVINM